MALLKECFCCSLLSGCIFFGLTTLVLYIMSFSLELWWVVEAEIRLPIPAYLLALAYFYMSILSLAMLIGLRTQRTRLLLAWLLFTLLTIFPEAGMVLFMAIYYWNGNTYGIIELGLWVFRLIFGICGMICTQSLFSQWRDDKMVLRSLEELNQANHSFIPRGEYQKHYDLGYSNVGFTGSHNNLQAPIVTKYSTNSQKPLKRSISSASQLAAAATMRAPLGLGGSTQHLHPKMFSAAQLTGYRKNEFDTFKFTTGLALRTQSQYDLPSFGLDPDEPVFLTSYGIGGLHSDSWKPPSKTSGPDSSLQWYRPRSLINMEDDTLSIWSESGKPSLAEMAVTQSLDRRKLIKASRLKAQSLGALNFSYFSSDEAGIVRGGVGVFHYRHPGSCFPPHHHMASESKQSLGQYSDHVEKYRDVAL